MVFLWLRLFMRVLSSRGSVKGRSESAVVVSVRAGQNFSACGGDRKKRGSLGDYQVLRRRFGRFVGVTC